MFESKRGPSVKRISEFFAQKLKLYLKLKRYLTSKLKTGAIHDNFFLFCRTEIIIIKIKSIYFKKRFMSTLLYYNNNITSGGSDYFRSVLAACLIFLITAISFRVLAVRRSMWDLYVSANQE